MPKTTSEHPPESGPRPTAAAGPEPHQARAVWWLFEPVHAVTYFTDEAREAFEDAGLRGFWRGYFAGRAAPLGAVGAAPVTAAFFGFAPGMVARALPDVWRRATPERALRARLDGAVTALQQLLAGVPSAVVEEAAGLLDQATRHLRCDGRVLAAANAAMVRPSEPLALLWHCATVLREHRGDGHVAALVNAGLDGCESLVLRAALDVPQAEMQPARGWSDEEWGAATGRLVERGWLTDSGAITPEGARRHREVEQATDRMAAAPWEELGPDLVARLTTVLTPIAAACRGVLPDPNPIALPVRT